LNRHSSNTTGVTNSLLLIIIPFFLFIINSFGNGPNTYQGGRCEQPLHHGAPTPSSSPPSSFGAFDSGLPAKVSHQLRPQFKKLRGNFYRIGCPRGCRRCCGCFGRGVRAYRRFVFLANVDAVQEGRHRRRRSIFWCGFVVASFLPPA
jgi:hypothetical protein